MILRGVLLYKVAYLLIMIVEHLEVSYMRKNTPVGISLPADLLEWIDQERGRIPRSRFVADILREAKRAYKERED